MKTICMSCKYFKIKDEITGVCRVDAKKTGSRETAKAVVRHTHSCDQWVDCGQLYYIRVGWVKARMNSAPDTPAG